MDLKTKLTVTKGEMGEVIYEEIGVNIYILLYIE